jgi:hypothetical protein
MRLAKAAPDSLKDWECEKMALRERPLIPYVPDKDSVVTSHGIGKIDIPAKMVRLTKSLSQE